MERKVSVSANTYETPAEHVRLGTLALDPEVAPPIFLERNEEGDLMLIQEDSGTLPGVEPDMVYFAPSDLPGLIALLQQVLPAPE
jgi:hypothetical protein